MSYRNISDVDVAAKRILLRADLNVPVRDGKIADLTRLERLSPTISELVGRGAKVVVCSHFDRPRGRRVPELSLTPVAAALGQVLNQSVAFSPDCIGESAEAAVAALHDGNVLVLENTRFHPGEEKNDPSFVKALASLADIYVNDAFSAAHRAHASTEGVAHVLPAYPGRLMEEELRALESALENPSRPVAAVVGGAKISTKLELLGNLQTKVDVLIIGGAMANTFLAAQGVAVGKSLQEPEMHAAARQILVSARDRGCEIVLPQDVVVAAELKAGARSEVVPISQVPAGQMILDVGPATVKELIAKLEQMKTLVWNGPFGAFEVPPFDAATKAFAHQVAARTQQGLLRSVAGGGDTVSALRQAGEAEMLSYVSTAGGAFLEWLEGKQLPGVVALAI